MSTLARSITSSKKYTVSAYHLAKKKDKSQEEIMPPLRTDEGWVTIKLGPKSEVISETLATDDMEERLLAAKKWVSKPLSGDGSRLLNRSKKIEEIIAEKKKGSLGLSDIEVAQTEKVRGFLEINPFICSGCGTPFQSKNADNPGFLSKEKFDDHRKIAAAIKEQQEAIKILEIAGIDVDSDAAEEVLIAAKIKKSIITSIRSIGKVSNMNGVSNSTNDNQLSARNNDNRNNIKETVNSIDEIFNDIDVNDIKSPIITRNTKIKQIKNNIQIENDAEVIVDTNDILKLDNNQQQQAAENNEQLCICQRCFRLQQYGQVEESLRPGWSDHDLLTPARFETLLSSIRNTTGVVLCIIDIFDIQGSLLKNLKAIAGPNPIVIAVNKLDLLPRDASITRITNWIYSEIKEYCGLHGPKDVDGYRYNQNNYNNSNNSYDSKPSWFNKKAKADRQREREEGLLRRSDVHLVSCQSGHGLQELMNNLMSLAAENENRVYVMGAANVGKSSFINRILEDRKMSSASPNFHFNNKQKKNKPLVTVSNLPGTTLDFLKIKLANGISVIDTPGLINPGQLTSKLNTAELKQVIPSKPINAVTLRLVEGKCVLIGGLAIIELVEGKPFFFTFVVSNEIKLHPTDSMKAMSFIQSHVGNLVSPPQNVERLAQIGPFVNEEFSIEGDSWKKSSKDIVIAGLGWIAITGPGVVKVKVTVPTGTNITLRDSLLPFEASSSTVKFTGGRLARKSSKGKNVKGYGWRA
eukprot:gene7291-9933_t